MKISSYEKEGKLLWMVYVNVRSRVKRSIRRQKRKYGFTSKGSAEREGLRIQRKLIEAVAQAELRGVLWGEVVDQWALATGSQPEKWGYNPVTIKDHVSLLYNWTGDWLKVPANEITRADCREVLDNAEDRGKSAKWQKKIKHTINVVFTWGIETRMIEGIEYSPVKGWDYPKNRTEKTPEILSRKQVRELLIQAKKLDNPWYPIWSMAVLTGMRSGELYALTWSDVNLEKKRIRVDKSYCCRTKSIKSTKSGMWRWVPINVQLEKLLIEVQSASDSRIEVLPRLWEWLHGDQARVLRTFLVSIGLPPVKFHALRACFATLLLEKNVAPARIMKIGGWSDLKTMQIYMRMAGIDEIGATDSLDVLPSDEALMERIVNIVDYRAEKS